VKAHAPRGSGGGTFLPSMNVSMDSLLANFGAQEYFHERRKQDGNGALAEKGWNSSSLQRGEQKREWNCCPRIRVRLSSKWGRTRTEAGEKQCVLTRVLRPLRSVEWAGFHFFPEQFSQADDLKLSDLVPQEFSILHRTLQKCKLQISPETAGKPGGSVSFLN